MNPGHCEDIDQSERERLASRKIGSDIRQFVKTFGMDSFLEVLSTEFERLHNNLDDLENKLLAKRSEEAIEVLQKYSKKMKSFAVMGTLAAQLRK